MRLAAEYVRPAGSGSSFTSGEVVFNQYPSRSEKSAGERGDLRCLSEMSIDLVVV